MKRKLLWHSNSPTAPTGYGTQTALFAPRLNADFDVAISAFYGLEGSPVKWNGMPLLPGLGGNFGAEYMSLHAARWGHGDPRNVLTVSLMDVWVLPPPLVAELGGNLICWTPIDHDPAPPRVLQFFKESAAVPLAMSRFGQEQLGKSALYCPHGVDTEAYKPHPQTEARQMIPQLMDIPKGSYVAGWIAANKGRPSRKGFAQGLEAWARFRAKHENAYLYLHTSIKHEWMQGENLRALIEFFNIPPESVRWADQYRLHFDPLKSKEMAIHISACDAMLNPCMGGGFEIVNLESAACGVPTITTNFTACPESAGPTPWKVGGTRFWTGQESMNLFADVDEIVDALEESYAMAAKERRALSRRLRHHAETYDADRVYKEHMLPSIKKAEKRLNKRGRGIDVTEGLQATPPDRNLTTDGPSISVVTPWHNHPELAEEYWKALDGEKTHEILVVDNASEPPVSSFLAVPQSRVRTIRLDENVGFCPANNFALASATGDAVLFLNNDVALGVPGWLETIRAELKPGVMVGANMRSDEHTRVNGEIQPYLDGWCIAALKEDLETLGGWDETYEEPAYFSDNDLCLRARRAGMRFVAVSPPLTHLENKTAGPPTGHVAEVTRRNYAKFAKRVREERTVAA